MKYASMNRRFVFSIEIVFTGTVSMPGRTRSWEIPAGGSYIGLREVDFRFQQSKLAFPVNSGPGEIDAEMQTRHREHRVVAPLEVECGIAGQVMGLDSFES